METRGAAAKRLGEFGCARRGQVTRRLPPARRLAVLHAWACFVVLGAAPHEVRADDWNGRDKALHFALSAGLAAGGYAGAALVFEPRSIRIAFGCGVGVLAGASKEVYDATGHGDPSWRDFTWDVIGTATGVTIALLIDALVSDRPAAAHSTSARPSWE